MNVTQASMVGDEGQGGESLTKDTLRRLSDAGVTTWLAGLNRLHLRSDRLSNLIGDSGVVGAVISFLEVQRAVDAGAYDGMLAELEQDISGADALSAIVEADAREAADILRPVYEATDHSDGLVSVEIPTIGRESTEVSMSAERLWAQVDRPNLLVAIPATPEGLPAITETIAAGIAVHVTLIFSGEQCAAAAEAYIAGLELAQASGIDLRSCASAASVCLSPIDTEVDKRLWAIASDKAAGLRGAAAVANARLTRSAHENAFYGPRWASLRAQGATPQRLCWAYTTTRDPYYSDTLYVDELIARGLVNAMSEATIAAVADRGTIIENTASLYDLASDAVSALKNLGVDLSDAVREVELKSAGRHKAEWSALCKSVESRLASFAK